MGRGFVSIVTNLAISVPNVPYSRVVLDQQLCRLLRGLSSVQRFSRRASRADLDGVWVVQFEGVSLLEHLVLGLEQQEVEGRPECLPCSSRMWRSQAMK